MSKFKEYLQLIQEGSEKTLHYDGYEFYLTKNSSGVFLELSPGFTIGIKDIKNLINFIEQNKEQIKEKNIEQKFINSLDKSHKFKVVFSKNEKNVFYVTIYTNSFDYNSSSKKAIYTKVNLSLEELQEISGEL